MIIDRAGVDCITGNIKYSDWLKQLRTFARNFSNIDFSLKILPLKDDQLVMSEMSKKIGGSPTSFWREHGQKST